MAGEYKTRHQEELLCYFKSIPGKHVTANDVCAHFFRLGQPMGLTTVYRQIERLVVLGVVKKYVVEGSGACFEYVGEDFSEHDTNCFHCKCTSCGRLIHLECHDIAALEEHLERDHHFYIDKTRTVFYGLCQECKSKSAGQTKEDLWTPEK